MRKLHRCHLSGTLQPGESPFHSSHIFLIALLHPLHENSTPDFKSYTNNYTVARYSTQSKAVSRISINNSAT